MESPLDKLQDMLEIMKQIERLEKAVLQQEGKLQDYKTRVDFLAKEFKKVKEDFDDVLTNSVTVL